MVRETALNGIQAEQNRGLDGGLGLHGPGKREVDLYVYTEEIDGLHDRIRDRVELVEGPHNMFYGMREVIIRDLNGFWITFGQEVPSDVLTPWPAVDSELLQPYAGRYKSDHLSRLSRIAMQYSSTDRLETGPTLGTQ